MCLIVMNNDLTMQNFKNGFKILIIVFVSEVDYDPDVFLQRIFHLFSERLKLQMFSLCLCCLGIMSKDQPREQTHDL